MQAEVKVRLGSCCQCDVLIAMFAVMFVACARPADPGAELQHFYDPDSVASGRILADDQPPHGREIGSDLQTMDGALGDSKPKTWDVQTCTEGVHWVRDLDDGSTRIWHAACSPTESPSNTPAAVDCEGHVPSTCSLFKHESLWNKRAANESDWQLWFMDTHGEVSQLLRGREAWRIPAPTTFINATSPWAHAYLIVRRDHSEGPAKAKIFLKIFLNVELLANVSCVGAADIGGTAPHVYPVNLASAMYLADNNDFVDFLPVSATAGGVIGTDDMILWFPEWSCNKLLLIRFRFVSDDGAIWGEYTGPVFVTASK